MDDLKTNLRFEEGYVKCHSTLDLELTSSGDLALVEGVDNTRQRLLLWFATPPGERLNPNIGCPWYNYQHKKNTESNLRELAGVMRYSLEQHFPDFKIRNVVLTRIDPFVVYADMTIGYESLRFLFSSPDIVELNKNVWAEFQENDLPLST
jgi:hypothetical protein